MRFVQGLLLGVAAGGLVAHLADVYRPFSLAAAILALVFAGVVSAWIRGGRTRTAPAVARVTSGAPASPGGFLAGRRLADALDWLALEHGIGTLDRVGVTEESLAVVGPGARGLQLALVTEHDGAFRAELTDVPAGSGPTTTSRFRAGDLAPDVLARALDRARREHPDTWGHVADAEAVVERPDRLRDEVTVRLHNGSLSGADQTLWASAAGDVLFVQESLS